MDVVCFQERCWRRELRVCRGLDTWLFFIGHVKIDLCQMLVDAGDHLQGLETWCCILVG